MPKLIFAPILFALALLCSAGPASAEPRVRSGEDTARRPLPEEPAGDWDEGDEVEPELEADAWPPSLRRPTGTGTIDPAVQRFWSERCVQQRRYGLPHTKDCDNPAYTGGGSDYRPYRLYKPSHSYPSHRPGWREGNWRSEHPTLPYRGLPEPEPRGSFRLPEGGSPPRD